jgi:hypothetical protein
MKREEAERLLLTEEGETLERKSSLSDKNAIRKTLIAFANDLSGNSRAYMIVGQADSRELVGLNVSPDEAQRQLADIARNGCTPAIPVSIDVFDFAGKQVAFVEVRASLARPHCSGHAWVRIGSTTREATDAEVMVLRAAQSDRKFARLLDWSKNGTGLVTVFEPSSRHSDPHFGGQRFSASWETHKLIEVTPDWVGLEMERHPDLKHCFNYSEFELAYDFRESRPTIRLLKHRGE